MGKELNNKGVKYVTNKLCKACNLLINRDAFYCVDCEGSVHAICAGLSRDTKILLFVTNRNFSCNSCIKQKKKYDEAVMWLDKLEESEKKERNLLNPPSCTNQPHTSCNMERSVQPQEPASPPDSRSHELYVQLPDGPPSTSGQGAIDEIVSVPDCIREEDSMETDNFVDANGASMLSQDQEIPENNSVLENMTYEADIQTQNSFTISTPLVPIRARVAYEKGIPDIKIDSVAFEEEEEMSNGEQEVNYQPNSARQGQSQRSTNHRLPIPSSPQQQTTPPPPNFSPANLFRSFYCITSTSSL